MRSKRKTNLKRILWIIAILFVFANTLAAIHAYKFTHFDISAAKTKDPSKLSFGDKLKTLLLGINNPRPVDDHKPPLPYTTVILKGNKDVECWLIKNPHAIGTVILFHGYSGNKSAEIEQAGVFYHLGYSTLLVDFMGSGGSAGNQTTIGFYEAEEVKSAVDYIAGTGEKNIILFGTSMGAAAVMKYLKDDQTIVKAAILECPFGTMLKTVQARFKSMHVPAFPMANLLVFWGGVENNFNAFDHNPQDYAKQIKCPILLMYGEKDDKVSRKEIDSIYSNLQGVKQLKVFPLVGHENYLRLYSKEWTEDVRGFLKSHDN